MKISISINPGLVEQNMELKTIEAPAVSDEPVKPPEPNLPVRLTDEIGDIIPWEKPDPDGYELDMDDTISPATIMTRMLESDEGRELMAKYDLSILGAVRGLLTMAYKTRPFTTYIKKGTR